jgi:hypothetical protein
MNEYTMQRILAGSERKTKGCGRRVDVVRTLDLKRCLCFGVCEGDGRVVREFDVLRASESCVQLVGMGVR